MPFEYKLTSVEEADPEEIEAALEERWQQGGFRFTRTFEELVTDAETNETVSAFIRSKIREAVDDPDIAEKLVPTDHYYATKRPPLNYDGYYQTFNRNDVQLVDVSESPIEEVTPRGIQTSDDHYDLDVIVFATGFDAMTGALFEMDILGRDGLTLAEKWADGPRTYLGLAVHGFPNLFTITGPQSPSVLTNMPVAIEQHVEWIADCVAYMRDRGFHRIEATRTAEDEWVAHTNEAAQETLLTEAESWYRGANVPGKPRIFTPYPGGLDVYREACAEVAQNGYEGFELAGPADPPRL